ncbi:MAG TPA: glycosyltransferase family 2 protein [Gaiellaceae bacterium]|nr:glycosyltransferase family 2 protein [Gaiellaceae bacterium]
MTRVAVVIPCFDDGATLREAVASLRSEEPHELVVIDDGSTDPGTRQVLDELAGGGVQVIRQENAGLSAARMAGVRATSAPYVFPLDADDLLVPGALGALADALDREPGAKLAWGDVEIFGDFDGRVAGARAFDAWQLTYVSEIPVASLIRRDALVEAGGWQLRGYEDWDLWMAFAERGWRGAYVGRAVIRHRQHGRRLVASMLDSFGAVYAVLRERHRPLFEARRANWRRSEAPWRVKLLFPVIGALPGVSALDKHRLCRLVSRPHETLRGRRRRLRAVAS